MGGDKDRKARREWGERERGSDRERRESPFFGENGNLIRSVFIVQIENQF